MTTEAKHKEAYEKLIDITKKQISSLGECGEDFTSQVEMRQGLLKYLENLSSKSLCELEENPLLNKLRKIAQTLRQKHLKNPLQQSC